LTQNVNVRLHYDLEQDFQLCYPSKWNIIKQISNSFSKAKFLVDELTNDEVNEELGWTFQGFELEEK
jgi:hypothetical protein